MPLTRWIISSNDSPAAPAKDAIVNTLYFNVSFDGGDPVDYESLGDDLMDIWSGAWAPGRRIDIRGYDMADPEPRPQKYQRTVDQPGTNPAGPHQVALCLSYFADRNIAGRRGRIYLGPWSAPGVNATATNTDKVINLAGSLAGLGGLNVDWSIYSPTKNEAYRINQAWCDDSWDIIRSRKLAAVSPRKTWSGNG